MKIGVFSDIHLEFRNRVDQVTELASKLQGAASQVDLMINAGDTHPNVHARRYVKDLFEDGKYIAIFGNHDYYGDTWDGGKLNVFEIDGIKFVTGTLWTNFAHSPVIEQCSREQIWDFRKIAGLTTSAATDAFNRMSELILEEKPDVVVSHFAPHPLSIHPKYYGEVLNPYFVSNLDDLIMKVQPKLWVHGHVHDPFDYTVGKTRVVCNPLGYPHERDLSEYEVLVVEL